MRRFLASLAVLMLMTAPMAHAALAEAEAVQTVVMQAEAPEPSTDAIAAPEAAQAIADVTLPSAAQAIADAAPPSAAPTVVVDEEGGYWLYESAALRVEIHRCTDDTPLVWYEADLRCTPEATLGCVLSSEKRPHKHLKKPETIAEEHALIYGQTDDFFGARVGSKKLKTGVVIRGGATLYDDPYRGNGNPFPTLDTLAFFPDGTLEAFAMKDYRADDYLAMGATDVLAFGPILLRDGEINEKLTTNYRDKEPRSAIGMIAPYHFFGMVVEGRHDGSKGCGLLRIAERMKEVGVTEALNLDGGQTAAMVFQGVQLNHTGKFKKKTVVRSVSGLLGVADAASAAVTDEP